VSVQILEDKESGQAVFFCSTSDWAFGPLFPSREAAELFLATDPRDPRLMPDSELEDSFNKFTRAYICECGNLRDEDACESQAYQIAPDGCTCPNNGGGDCPWCEAKTIAQDWEPEAGERFICVFCERKRKAAVR